MTTDWKSLKDRTKAAIYENDTESITGDVLQRQQLDVIDTIGKAVNAVEEEQDSDGKALAAEVTRAKAAEEKNAQAIAAETQRATQAETTLKADVVSEQKRAEAAEKANAQEIAGIKTKQAEEGARIDSLDKEMGQVKGDLTAEIARAKAAEQQNAAAITTFEGELEAVKARQVEDGEEIDKLGKDIGKLDGDLRAEVNRATNAEGKLSQHIDALFEVSPAEPQNPNTAAWVNPEGDVVEVCPEAPKDGKSYVRKNGAWYDAVPEGGYMRELYEAMPNVKWNPVTKMYDIFKEKGGISVTKREMLDIYNNAVGNPIISTGYLIQADSKAIISKSTGFYGNTLMNGTIDSRYATFIGIGEALAPLKDVLLNVTYLETCINPLEIRTSRTYSGSYYRNLKFRIAKTNALSVSIKNAQNISYATLRSIPDNVIGDTYSNTTTITVHSTPYSLLTGTATDEQYTETGHTKAEWMQIVTDSAAKGITFTQALQRTAAFARAIPEPTRIEGAEIVAGTDKALKRPGIDGYFQRATLLDGETVESFEEVPLQVAIDCEIEQEKKQEDERSNILGERPEDR